MAECSPRIGAIGGSVIALALTIGLCVVLAPESRSIRRDAAPPRILREHAGVVTKSRSPGNAPEAPLQAFVREHEDDPRPAVQDLVVDARMRLGYVSARRGDFDEARIRFEHAAATAPPTEETDPAYGTRTDQAAYQAIVCLAADGQTERARQEFRAFLKERPTSPLAKAAFRRLERLNGGEPTDEDVALMETATKLQNERAHFELRTCGPKAISKALELLRLPARDYREIAKDCDLGEHGVTMRGMLKGLAASGIRGEAFSLNRRDFARLRPPAIWLVDNHYVLVLSVKGTQAEVHDPRFGERLVPIPPLDDALFTAPVILLRPAPDRGARP